MTNRPQEPSKEPSGVDDTPTSIVVPGVDRRDLTDEELATELQQVRDLGSASRSCVAIIVVLLIVALVLCVFLFWAFVIQ